MSEVIVRKWGHSQGVILPKDVCERAGVRVGQSFDIRVEGATLHLVPSRNMTIDALLAGYEGEAPREYEWGEPVGKEIW